MQSSRGSRYTGFLARARRHPSASITRLPPRTPSYLLCMASLQRSLWASLSSLESWSIFPAGTSSIACAFLCLMFADSSSVAGCGAQAMLFSKRNIQWAATLRRTRRPSSSSPICAKCLAAGFPRMGSYLDKWDTRSQKSFLHTNACNPLSMQTYITDAQRIISHTAS